MNPQYSHSIIRFYYFHSLYEGQTFEAYPIFIILMDESKEKEVEVTGVGLFCIGLAFTLDKVGRPLYDRLCMMCCRLDIGHVANRCLMVNKNTPPHDSTNVTRNRQQFSFNLTGLALSKPNR